MLKSGSQTFSNFCVKDKPYNMDPAFFWLLPKGEKFNHKNVTTFDDKFDEKNCIAFNGIVLW